MRRKMCVVSSMSVLSVSSGMAGEPIRRPWARCISINDDDRAQWIDNDEGGVVGIKANGEYTHVRLLSNGHRPSNARADAVAVGWSVMSQSGCSSVALHRRNGMVSEALYEHAATLRAAVL